MKKRLLSLVLTLAMVLSFFPGMTMTANAAEEAPTHDDNHTGWQEILEISSDLTLNSGSYYLSENITTGKKIYIDTDQEVTICLNGHVLELSSADNAVYLKGNSTLNICDCQAGKVTTYGNISAGRWERADESGDADLSGGVITRNAEKISELPLIRNVANAEKATLNMYSGNLAGNKNTYTTYNGTAGILMVTSSSSINLYGGTLTGLVSANGASAVCAAGNLNLAGTVIEGNTASNAHTVMWKPASDSGATASITGGVIRNNQATNGAGAICVCDGNGTFTMSGGEISGNEGKVGGVSVQSGTFKMTGGEIKANESTASGGGIFAGNGKGIVEISGGTISGNTAASNGGGICVGDTLQGGTVKISGGRISGNTAANYGSGVYVAAIGTNKLELSGDAYIYDNFKNDGQTASNVTLWGSSSRTSYRKITAGTFNPGATVGVGFEIEKGYRTFTEGATTDVTSVFVSDNPDLLVTMGSDGQANLGYEIRLQLEVANGTTHWPTDTDRTVLTVTPTMYNAKDELVSATFKYQWRKSANEDLSGATLAATVANNADLRVTATGPYYYFCDVSVTGEMAPPVRSDVTYAVLKDYTSITINESPQDITLYTRDLANDNKLKVTATASDPEAALSYQWFGGPADGRKTEIPGATSAEYILPKDLAIGEYAYYCAVNAVGASRSSNSTSATVTVKAPELTVTQNFDSNQIRITMLDEYTLKVTATCNGFDGEPQYQWYTCRSSDGSSRTIIDGATDASYTFKPDSSGYKYFICEVTAGGATKSSGVAYIYVQSLNVSIDTNIDYYANYDVALGGTKTLKIRASNSQGMEVGYQWYSCTNSNKDNATPVEGATNASFDVPTDTKGTCYYFCRAYLVGYDTSYKDSRVAQINVYVAYNLTTADPVGEDGWATVAGGKYYVNTTCAEGGSPYVEIQPDDGYTVDTYTVYKTGEPGTIVASGSGYPEFTMPGYDVTVKVTFKVLQPIEKVDLQLDWSRVPALKAGDNILASEFSYYNPAVFADGAGAANGPLEEGYWAIRVTDDVAARILAATGTPAEEWLEDFGYGTWLLAGDLKYYGGISKFELAATDELAIMTYVYPYEGYFPYNDDYTYAGTVTCNNETVAYNVVDYRLMSFIEVGTVDELTAKQTTAGTADRYNVYYVDECGYTTGGSYGVMPGIAKANDPVAIRITPNDGYMVDTVICQKAEMETDEGGDNAIAVTLNKGVYTFNMPSSNVIVKVTFKAKSFSDEDKLAAAKEAIQNAINRMTATNDTTEDSIQAIVDEALANAAGVDGVTADVAVTTKTDATTDAAGSVVGSVAISCGDKSDSVAFEKTIEKIAATATDISQGLTITGSEGTYTVGGLAQYEDEGSAWVYVLGSEDEIDGYVNGENGIASVPVGTYCISGADVLVNATFTNDDADKTLVLICRVRDTDEYAVLAYSVMPLPVEPGDEEPEHKHNYTYTSNNNGTHNYTCVCGEGEETVENQNCTYVNGKCEKCGYVPTYSVTIPVVMENESGVYDSCNEATVTLISSNGTEKSLTYSGAGDGKYSANGIVNGDYNVVVKVGEKVKTVLVTVNGRDVTLTDAVKISKAKINSTVEVDIAVSEDSPVKGALVGGLDDLADVIAAQAKTEAENLGATVDVDVSMKIESTVSNDVPAVEKNSIESVAQEQSAKLTFLDIAIKKTVTVKKTGDQDSVMYYDSSIHDATQLLKIVFPFDTEHKEDFAVYRYHTESGNFINAVQKLVELKNGEDPNTVEHIEIGDGVITMYVQYFSTYAIGYTETNSNNKPNNRPSGGIYVPPVKPAEPVSYDKCKHDGECPLNDFSDLSVNAWYHDAVHYCIDKGLMNGYGSTFRADGVVTRQQVWMMLARLSGEDPANMAAARVWAMENGVSDGTNPTNAVTRQQFITMLYRYAVDQGYDVSVGEDTNILSYADAFSVSEYAIPAMQWGCGSGIMGGYADGSLKPVNGATRAHVAAFLQRFCEGIAR